MRWSKPWLLQCLPEEPAYRQRQNLTRQEKLIQCQILLVHLDISEKYFHNSSPNEISLNTNSLQRHSKRPKYLVIWKTTDVSIKTCPKRRKTHRFLQSYDNYWNAEFICIGKGLSAAQFNGEFKQKLRPADKTYFHSASKTSKSLNQDNKDCKPGDREPLENKIINDGIYGKVSSHILSYFDDCLGYAQSFFWNLWWKVT